VPRRVRRPTRPTAASKLKRRQTKARRAEIKHLRARPRRED
jgi:hypothetical protein